MTVDLQNPLVQMRITALVCGIVAIATTIARLWIHRARLWFDDAWASFSLITLFVFVGAILLHVAPDPERLSKLTRVAAYYVLACTFYTVIWSARLSILFSIIRIDSDPLRRRRMFGVAALFGLVALILIGQLFWICEPEGYRTGWKNKPNPQCNLGKQVAITQLVSDAIADTILLVAPLRILMGLMDKTLRKRLMIIFSTCIVTTIVSLVHAAYIIKNGGPKILIAAIVENTMSLIVCNVPVVISATIYARRSGSHPSNERLAISTFNMRFAKNPTCDTDDSGFGGSTLRGTRYNRSAPTRMGTIDITTVTQVSVSPKEQPWTFMDDSDSQTIDIRSSRETMVKEEGQIV